MKVGDEVYGWFGGPGPNLSVGIVLAVADDGEPTEVYDACWGVKCAVKNNHQQKWKPLTDEVCSMKLGYGGDNFHVPSGTYTMRQLLDVAHHTLAVRRSAP